MKKLTKLLILHILLVPMAIGAEGIAVPNAEGRPMGILEREYNLFKDGARIALKITKREKLSDHEKNQLRKIRKRCGIVAVITAGIVGTVLGTRYLLSKRRVKDNEKLDTGKEKTENSSDEGSSNYDDNQSDNIVLKYGKPEPLSPEDLLSLEEERKEHSKGCRWHSAKKKLYKTDKKRSLKDLLDVSMMRGVICSDWCFKYYFNDCPFNEKEINEPLSEKGETAMDLVFETSNWGILKALLKNKAKLEDKHINNVCKIVSNGYIGQLELLCCYQNNFMRKYKIEIQKACENFKEGDLASMLNTGTVGDIEQIEQLLIDHGIINSEE